MDREYFMRKALKEAEKAEKKGEVPVGALVVKDGEIIARGHNLRECRGQAAAHAEILAIEKACRKLGTWRLSGCDVYVTLEPCPMCAGAMLQARIDRLYFGAYDPKFGAVGSKLNLFYDYTFNHRISFAGGILEEECSQILSDFFLRLRKRPPYQKKKQSEE